MNINKNANFGTHNTSERVGNIQFICIHYVGATGDAEANLNYYNQKTTTGASADFFVGHGGDIWQYNPDPKARYCWSVGGGKQSAYGGQFYGVCRNNNSVSIELCVKNKGGNKNPNSRDWYFTDETVDAAVDLTKYLMNLYEVPVERVIRHYDVNGKFCPGVFGWNPQSGSEDAWLDFKRKIAAKGEKVIYRVQAGAYKDRKNADKQIATLEKAGIDAILVFSDKMFKVQIGAFTVYSNAVACLENVKRMGFEAYITTRDGGMTIKKSAEEIAKEVVRGKWGNGAERKAKLKAAGYNYDRVQEAVNRLL